MKKLQLVLVALLIGFTTNISAQTAEEIIANYFENTGGLENWQKLEGIKMTAKINQNGMEIPLELVNLKDGKQMVKINFQGKELKQGVFDGQTLWSTNFMTQKAEKSDKEATDMMKLQANDFPTPFLNYKEKGYTVELIGKEEIDGTEAFKIKLTQEPVMVDGKEEESVSYYFFDTENYVPIVIHAEIKQGQAKGMMSETKMSDYDEVDGLFFAFSMSQGVKGQPGGQPIAMDSIELNPKVDAKEFMFPEETEATPKANDGNKN